MSWFKHHHWWILDSVSAVYNRGADRAKGELRLETCRCGAVRSIEIYPGEAPVVRIAATPERLRETPASGIE